MSALQRITDWRRERRIRQLAELVKYMVAHGERAEAADAWQQMRAEILARSPQQIARMERAQGLRNV